MSEHAATMFGWHALSSFELPFVPRSSTRHDLHLQLTALQPPRPKTRVAHFLTPRFRFQAFTDAASIQLDYSGLATATWLRTEQRLLLTSHTPESDGLLDALLCGSIPAALRASSGECVLHASVVRRAGLGFGFVGGSGSGKSTLAAALCRTGATLVADDAALVRGDGVEAHAGNTALRLRTAAAQIGALANPDGARYSFDGRYLARVESAAATTRLDALVFPQVCSESERVSVEVLGPTASLHRLLEQPRVRGITDPELLTRQLSNYTRLLGRLPCFRATIPDCVERCTDFANEVCEQVVSELSNPPPLNQQPVQTGGGRLVLGPAWAGRTSEC